MATATSVVFVARLRKHQLLEPAQLQEVEQTLAAQFPETKALARELVQRGWLTVYQVNQISKNQAADLRLGNYLVLDRLGEGGMGAVLKARHGKMGRVVALKIIRKDRLTSADAVQRFQREVRAAAQLNHVNIVQAHDADEANGTHFLAMEYVEGKDLGQVVKETGPLPIAEACDCIRQAALGLQHAHAKGLVHRDIKPANLLVDGAGVVKILDLGIARMSGDIAAELTQEGAIVGSIDYLAPEQAQNSHTVDIRADLYSLGCTFYQLLTGQVPFPGGHTVAKLTKHQLDDATPVEQLRPEVPSGVAAIVRKLMAKKPQDRYQTPAELVGALDQWARGERHPADGTVVTDERWNPVVNPATVAYVPARHRPPRPFGFLVAVVGGLMVVALALLIFRVLPNHPPVTTPLDPEQELERLLARAADDTIAAEQRRDEVFAFCLKYAGKPAAYRAGQALPKLPPLVNSIGMRLAPIPPGTFLMGTPPEEAARRLDEVPQHEVELTHPFFMGVHEVTKGQFRAFVQASGYRTLAEKKGGASRLFPGGKWEVDPKANWQNPGFEQTDAHPVVCIKWEDAKAFCDWLSKQEGRIYRLPTEAEWEYCCRAGTNSRYYSGNDEQSLKKVANVADASLRQRMGAVKKYVLWDDGHPFTAPVGSFLPNAFGLFDMHGNAWEWCQDWFDPDYYKTSPRQNPPGPVTGDRHVLRGGAWYDSVDYCRAADRHRNRDKDSCHANMGFRVVLVPIGARHLP